MRIGTSIDTGQPIDDVIQSARDAKEGGFSSVWSSQIFGADALTVFAAVAREVDGIQFATGVVPIQPRHPQVLAQQALTVQAISKGRLTLGIGLSHQVVVEGMWGLPFDKPGTYMREYLDALLPMLRGETVDVRGEFIRSMTISRVGPEVTAPPKVVVAALGPVMLKLAGARTDGTVTWMTGITTLRDYIIPTIRQAAEEAGRSAPEVIASLPVCLTDDVVTACETINSQLAIYPTLPSYKAMMDKEGATTPAEIGLVGSRQLIEDAVGELSGIGVTEVVVGAAGSRDEQAATNALLAEIASR